MVDIETQANSLKVTLNNLMRKLEKSIQRTPSGRNSMLLDLEEIKKRADLCVREIKKLDS